MTNTEKYGNCFIEIFGVKEEQLPNLAYQSVTEWDSVGHMSLMAELEDVFEIMLDMDDIIDFSDYKKGMELLGKYDVEF